MAIFDSKFNIDEEVKFLKSWYKAKIRTGKIVFVKFTKTSISYGILDTKEGRIFENIDSDKIFGDGDELPVDKKEEEEED